jgi:hypothetical protein
VVDECFRFHDGQDASSAMGNRFLEVHQCPMRGRFKSQEKLGRNGFFRSRNRGETSLLQEIADS